MNTKLHEDAAIIDSFGGPAKLARILGYDTGFPVQRIQNWKYRGIPEIVRLRRPDVFGPAPTAVAVRKPSKRAA